MMSEDREIARQLCSHDIVKREVTDLEALDASVDQVLRELGDGTVNEEDLGNRYFVTECYRCESTVGVREDLYRQHPEPVFTLRRRGQDTVYQKIVLYTRLDRQRSNL